VVALRALAREAHGVEYAIGGARALAIRSEPRAAMTSTSTRSSNPTELDPI
jgi:hypothetical protein